MREPSRRAEHLDHRAQVAHQPAPAVPAAAAVGVAEAALVVGVDAEAAPGEGRPGLGEGEPEVAERVDGRSASRRPARRAPR